MSGVSRCRTEVLKQWREKEVSPERAKVWSEPRVKLMEKKAAVVYYLSRNGQLEQPHFMEVSLPFPDGLYLRDVVNRLNALRGKGMASLYSWSSKRNYKNGYVWHDLSEEDFIHPVHGNEYVLKGTELLYLGSTSFSQDTAAAAAAASSASSSAEKLLEIPKSARDEAEFSASVRQSKKNAWSSLDLNEYKVYKTDLTAADCITVRSTDAATQTEERRHRRRGTAEAPNPTAESGSTELTRDEISPPPSSSSPETMETLIRTDGRILSLSRDDPDRTVVGGRVKASAVLMHLISCGSISVKEQGISLVSQYGRRLPRGGGGGPEKEVVDRLGEIPSFRVGKVLVEKEYFSGSLVETNSSIGETPVLQRSSSFNAERGMKMELAKEVEGIHSRCMPRNNPKSRKELGRTSYLPISRSTPSSKRFTT